MSWWTSGRVVLVALAMSPAVAAAEPRVTVRAPEELSALAERLDRELQARQLSVEVFLGPAGEEDTPDVATGRTMVAVDLRQQGTELSVSLTWAGRPAGDGRRYVRPWDEVGVAVETAEWIRVLAQQRAALDPNAPVLPPPPPQRPPREWGLWGVVSAGALVDMSLAGATGQGRLGAQVRWRWFVTGLDVGAALPVGRGDPLRVSTTRTWWSLTAVAGARLPLAQVVSLSLLAVGGAGRLAVRVEPAASSALLLESWLAVLGAEAGLSVALRPEVALQLSARTTVPIPSLLLVYAGASVASVGTPLAEVALCLEVKLW